MEDSKDYFVARIVTNEEMQCSGYMDFLCRNMKEQISNGILAIVSDGNEYAIKMLPEQRIKKTDMMSVEVRQGISVKELVRCRECQDAMYGNEHESVVWCAHYSEWKSKDGFCDEGGRKEKG